MAIYVVAVPKVEVKLNDARSTVTVHLPKDYRSVCIDDPGRRRQLEKLHVDDPTWIREQLDKILDGHAGTGILADPEHPMRSPGAGVLPYLALDPSNGDRSVILHVRGSNRGKVWGLGTDIAHVFGWKAFAGITGSADELEDPRKTAIMELYEELSLISNDKMLLPTNIHSYPEVFPQLETALKRIKGHYQFNLSFSHGHYEAVEAGDLEGDDSTWLEIVTPSGTSTQFKAIVNYDPFTNSLEASFLTTLQVHLSLTGLLSLSGPENDDVALKPYMEDIVVVNRDDLIEAEPGKEVRAIHLLSVHGPTNYANTHPGRSFYVPSPTLEPIVAHMKGQYNFRSVLKNARDKLRRGC
jgi:hypothetical protein